MTTGKQSLEQFLADAKTRDSYWVERAKLEFSISLERERKKAGLSYADIARKLEKSPAYISKVFRGDTNLTIESLVKLARAIGCNFYSEIADQSKKLMWYQVTEGKRNSF